MKIKKISLMLCCIFLSGCAYNHVPHYVDPNEIPERAMSISQQTQSLNPHIITLALNAYNKAQSLGYGNKHILTIIDYSKPSSNNRFWVINLDTNRVLFRELVAHGIGSGDLYSTNFSDRMDSKQSSIGMYVTNEAPYRGRHGYSLRLIGLEPGFNGNAYKRAIVIHGASYVCQEWVEEHGILGQSWGCPALNPRDLKRIINTIAGGTLVFAYANNPVWLNQSVFLKPMQNEVK